MCANPNMDIIELMIVLNYVCLKGMVMLIIIIIIIIIILTHDCMYVQLCNGK